MVPDFPIDFTELRVLQSSSDGGSDGGVRVSPEVGRERTWGTEFDRPGMCWMSAVNPTM